jgi:hypothetical protein
MKLLVGESKLALERDQMVTLRGGNGVRIACVTGALWVTQEQDRTDVILEAGQSLVVDHSGLTVIMALGAATLRVCEPRGTGLWRSLLDWLRPSATGTAAAF